MCSLSQQGNNYLFSMIIEIITLMRKSLSPWLKGRQPWVPSPHGEQEASPPQWDHAGKMQISGQGILRCREWGPPLAPLGLGGTWGRCGDNPGGQDQSNTRQQLPLAQVLAQAGISRIS